MPSAWLLNTKTSDLSAPNQLSPNKEVSIDELESIGVYMRNIDLETLHKPHPSDDEGRTHAERLAWNLGYKGIERFTLPVENNNNNNNNSGELEEHLNTDEQIRIVETGIVYFDVRGLTHNNNNNNNNKEEEEECWLRIEAHPGDVLVLPPGLYHRLVPASINSNNNNNNHNNHNNSLASLTRMMRGVAHFHPLPRAASQHQKEALAAQEEHKYYIAHPPTETILGPANNKDNILITNPRAFDATLEEVKSKLHKGDVLVLLFKGASNRRTHESWCPPCVIAEPMVQQAVTAAKLKQRVVFIQSIIERSVYLGNPDYDYRKHPFIGIKTIPYLMVLQQSENGLTEVCRESDPGDGYVSWVDRIGA